MCDNPWLNPGYRVLVGGGEQDSSAEWSWGERPSSTYPSC